MTDINRISTNQNVAKVGETSPLSRLDNSLAQEDFLKLLVAQMSHQDPMEPEKPGEFLGQLAQFGTVDGIHKLNESMLSMNNGIHSNQALQAASLVGRSVHIRSDKGQLTNQGEFRGSIEINAPTNDVKVAIKNLQGNVVKEIRFGNQNGGSINFEWNGIGDNGQIYPQGEYSVEATGNISGRNAALKTFAVANVDSVTVNPGSHDVSLNLHGYGTHAMSSVTKIS